MDYQTLKINKDFRVEIANEAYELQLSDSVKELIEKIWQNECSQKNLFDGSFFSAVSFNDQLLQGKFVPYKYFIAQLKEPSLKPILKIRPVGVSGLTLIGDNVVFAKRSAYVTQFPNYYELAPSGGIDRECVKGKQVHIKEQIEKELAEELGVPSKRIRANKLFALIYDKELESIDLCAEIRINPFAMHSYCGEYSQLLSVPQDELSSFVKMEGEHFVPLSIFLLYLRKYIK